MVLKSQILAFRRLKRGERVLPADVLRSIGPPPLSSQQNIAAVDPTTATERHSYGVSVEAPPAVAKDDLEQRSGTLVANSAVHKPDGKAQKVSGHVERTETASLQQSQIGVIHSSPATMKQEETSMAARPTPESIVNQGSAECPAKEETRVFSNTNVASRPTSPTIMPPATGSTPAKKTITANSNPHKGSQVLRRYRGPLFDFPPIGRKLESCLQANSPWGGPIPLRYDVRQLLLKEGARVIDKKRVEKLKALDFLLASGLDKKHVPAELILKLRIEQKKLRLMAMQSRIREEVEEQQQDIMAMSERAYRKFVRLCERQRADLARQVVQLQKTTRERQLKSVFLWRKRLLEAHWAIRDARTTRNRGVAKYHERMLREFSKRRDEDRNRRMEALKNNDVDTYREMLKQQQTKLPGDAGERFQVLSSFLSQTEDYLHKLGGKISAVKTQQEREEAAVAAIAAAKAQGLSEEEVEAAAAQASEEVDARCQLPDSASDSVSKYYSLAHAVNERIVRQPSMLRAGVLRDYQLVGLQWMLSLYNNRLNGILADEMGLGKTVQVMALIAYLMEFKGNYGPHLIIVPNAVMVNWKSELLRWIPSVSCIFYVGVKDQRSKLYSQEVSTMKFNVLVTTYEFIMRDRSKLSKVDWKYLIIDEAQRMKDRDSRLARDLDRFRCQRRLLLTGTPLQNDLRELWSLLNLLLPEVFDNSKSFHDWFSTPFQKDNSSQSPEDDWLETEKKVIVIHRLHQILEPFMLRRRVEDVEGSLPPKVPVVLRCKMSALQAAIYDWIKVTGTIRLDPEDEAVRVAAGNGKKQMRAYVPLQNKCMELRKVCNHPFLNYPLCGDRMNEFSVRSCGKLWILDRILIKLQNTGHRVLLFSTMTKLLDILEEYLQWRGLVYRRIDGTTTLESRESAIVEFNRPGSDCFIFLLSIRAAGRGLNLQSADTVIIYDPDPNPKNEEQAVARAHRIGQKREVRVIYMEAVVETTTSYEKEDELRSGGTIDMDDDDMAGKDRYVGSVESLVRNTIQQHKIDMADEVINAGRFDQRTTHEERRLTLEALLHDEERYQERVHDVPSLQEVNRMIARSDEEVDLFDQMDEEYEWPGEMLQHHQIPKWLSVGSREVNGAIAAMSRQASKKCVVEIFGTTEEEEKLLSEPLNMSLEKKLRVTLERKHGSENGSKGKGPSSGENQVFEAEKSDEALEATEQKVQRDGSDDEEEGEIREEFEDEEIDAQLNAEQEEGELSEDELDSRRGLVIAGSTQTNLVQQRPNDLLDVPSESSHDEDDEFVRNQGDAGQTPPMSQQKFGSLAALESRPVAQLMAEELEEGEIAASGDSPFEGQPSESWVQEQEDGEEEQAVQLPTKRKRSARQHRRRPLEKHGTSGCNYFERKLPPQYQLKQFPAERPSYDIDRQFYQVDRPVFDPERQGQRLNEENDRAMEPMYWKQDQWVPPFKRRHVLEPMVGSRPIESFPSPQPRILPQLTKVSGFVDQDDELTKESVKATSRLGSSIGIVVAGRMPENTQKKCKAVLQKLKGAVDKDGRQIAAIFELPKYSEAPGYYKVVANPIDARTIEQHLDKFEYGSVLDFAADVQLMLDNAARYFNSTEVKAAARRLQASYFQRMGLNFPDVDFSCVKTRTLATLSQPVPGPSPRPQNTQGGSGKPQAEPGASQVVRPNAKMGATNEGRVSEKGVQKTSKKGKVKVARKSLEREKLKSDRGAKGESSEVGLRHPVDLIFCKKKRKDRGKVSKKVRTIGAATDNASVLKIIGTKVNTESDTRVAVKTMGKKVRTAVIGSTNNAGDLKSAVSSGGMPAQTVHGKVQVGVIKGNVTLGPQQWLPPVKKMRTDGGKRRPSHL